MGLGIPAAARSTPLHAATILCLEGGSSEGWARRQPAAHGGSHPEWRPTV